MLEAVHESHPGMESMLRELYWWPRMTKDVSVFSYAICNIRCAEAIPKVVRETPEKVWQYLVADFKGPIIWNGKSFYFHLAIRHTQQMARP